MLHTLSTYLQVVVNQFLSSWCSMCGFDFRYSHTRAREYFHVHFLTGQFKKEYSRITEIYLQGCVGRSSSPIAFILRVELGWPHSTCHTKATTSRQGI
jgi:hypothetical protein